MYQPKFRVWKSFGMGKWVVVRRAGSRSPHVTYAFLTFKEAQDFVNGEDGI